MKLKTKKASHQINSKAKQVKSKKALTQTKKKKHNTTPLTQATNKKNRPSKKQVKNIDFKTIPLNSQTKLIQINLTQTLLTSQTLPLEKGIDRKALPSYKADLKTKTAKFNQRQKLIEEYTPLIRFIAKKISVRLPANIDVEDLVSNGVIGLMDAIDKYDATRDNKFKTYAEFRIRGAILDGLRAQDWVPRSVRDKAKMLERSHTQLETKLGRLPTDKETAEHLGLTPKEFYNLLSQTQPVNMLSIDSATNFQNMDRKSFFHVLQTESNPFSHLNVKSVKTEIKKMIATLPERQRIVLSLYYYEGFNLRKIGSILGVTESRVSQLHAQAIQRLKVKLEQAFKEHELKVAA